MIRFRGTKPTRVNHLCKICVNPCKQHRDLKIIRCLGFQKISRKGLRPEK